MGGFTNKKSELIERFIAPEFRFMRWHHYRVCVYILPALTVHTWRVCEKNIQITTFSIQISMLIFLLIQIITHKYH